jgi:hypothetical protein
MTAPKPVSVTRKQSLIVLGIVGVVASAVWGGATVYYKRLEERYAEDRADFREQREFLLRKLDECNQRLLYFLATPDKENYPIISYNETEVQWTESEEMESPMIHPTWMNRLRGLQEYLP